MSVESKAKRVLALILFAFFSLVLRVWHLAVIQREDRLLDAQKPQQRTLLVRADRGPIVDRFGIPLALNRICYNAAIYYGQIAEIPTIAWRGDQKVFARKEYIRNLSKVLAQTLHLDAERVEDLIHSKAALFPHVPYLLKEKLTEEEHYRLRMLEKDWVGIHAEIASTRFYPQGKTACEIVGTMGAISQKEYAAIAQEMSELMVDPVQNYERLAELKEKAYAMNDWVGKSGIEAQCEEDLRGFFGKKTFEVDQKGRFRRELLGREPIGGKQVVLSISSELQQFAESLLAQDDKTRDGRSRDLKQPWIKGGAIVALDPKTGEVLALASHPRFDPNDFIAKNKEVHRWLENDSFIAAVWDGREELIRERPKQEAQPLTWELTLDLLFAKESPIRQFFNKLDDIKGFIQFQEDYEAMLYFTKRNQPVPADIQKRLDAIPLSPQDKLFAADLCRTVVYAPAFTDALIAKVGAMKISTYRTLCQNFLKQESEARKKAQEAFHQNEFKIWREANQKEFLAEKRKLEKENKTYPRPYLDYLDQKEAELFSAYWEEKKFEGMSDELVRTFRSYAQLSRPLLGKYKSLRNRKKEQTEKDMAAAFYPIGGFGFSRSFAFQAGSPQGSIFKLVTAYEGLRQGKHLSIIDELSEHGVAYTLNKTLYPRFYKGGRLPRSVATQMGKIDLLGALEQTSNPYFSILAGDLLDDPDDLALAAKTFGFGEKTGIELPHEKRGRVPTDLKTNRTGLYSTAIGQHTLLTTPLQTANMLASLANGGKLLRPKLIKERVGLSPDHSPLKPFAARHYLAENELKAIGIGFPLFTAREDETVSSHSSSSSELIRTVPMTPQIRQTLLEAMDRVVWGPRGSARPTAIKALLSNPLLMRDYLALEHQMIGKTSTAEIVCNLSVNPSSPPQVYKHIWFGSIAFADTKRTDPELVVVVFLRYGDAGKEAAPLAAQMIHKWREIKKKHL
jgi:cell division protein FtsI/penicillin-binding protein 2